MSLGDMYDVTGKFNPQTGAVENTHIGLMMYCGNGQLFLPDGVTTTNPTGAGEQSLAVNYVQGAFFRSFITSQEINAPYNHFTPAPKGTKQPKSPPGYKYKIGSNIQVGKAYQLDTHYNGRANGFVSENLGQAKVTGRANIAGIDENPIDCWLVRRQELDSEWAVPV